MVKTLRNRRTKTEIQQEFEAIAEEVAEKAIEGASGARKLSHLNQIAMEQAKNRSTIS